MVMLVSSVVDRGFICGVIVIMLPSSVVDRGFICGVMVIMLPSSVVDRGSNQGRVKPDYKIGICCFSAKHTALRRKNKE